MKPHDARSSQQVIVVMTDGEDTQADVTAAAQDAKEKEAQEATEKAAQVASMDKFILDMFKAHQGGTFLPVDLQSPDYAFGAERIPAVSASAAGNWRTNAARSSRSAGT